MQPNKITRILKIAFGIFMVLVYVGMGVLVLMHTFDIPWRWAEIVFGIVLIAYGLFRGYREITGESYYEK